jgi:hypothetical protein
MGSSAGGMAVDPSALAGATGSMAAAAPGGAGGMAGGWTPPPITGGTASLYGAPGATGGMDPGAPAQPSWLADHPKIQSALLQYGAELMNQKRQQQAPPQAMPGYQGHWQPPQPALSQGVPGAPGPVWGGYRGPY